MTSVDDLTRYHTKYFRLMLVPGCTLKSSTWPLWHVHNYSVAGTSGAAPLQLPPRTAFVIGYVFAVCPNVSRKNKKVRKVNFKKLAIMFQLAALHNHPKSKKSYIYIYDMQEWLFMFIRWVWVMSKHWYKIIYVNYNSTHLIKWVKPFDPILLISCRVHGYYKKLPTLMICCRFPYRFGLCVL